MLEQFVWCVPMELYVMTVGMFSKSAPWDKLDFLHHGKHLIEIHAKKRAIFFTHAHAFPDYFLGFCLRFTGCLSKTRFSQLWPQKTRCNSLSSMAVQMLGLIVKKFHLSTFLQKTRSQAVHQLPWTYCWGSLLRLAGPQAQLALCFLAQAAY